jgi:hypothetical protein
MWQTNRSATFFVEINISQTFQKTFEKAGRVEWGHKSKTRRYMIMSNKELEMKAREHDLSDVSPEVVAEVTEAAAEEVTAGYQKVEQGVVTGYKKIENGVVNGYLKIQNGIVEGFCKVMDKCIDVLFAREGETVEQAKARLSRKACEAREEAQTAEEAPAQE